MTNKELIQKLESLKAIEPEAGWRKSNREILYSQISNTTTDFKESVFVSIKNFFAQPSFAVLFTVAVLVVGSIFGVKMLNPMPGDSLYIARVVSEKAQLAMTFNQEKKTKLGLKFANERAKSIAQVLAGADFSGQEDNSEIATRLKDDFKKELDTVKDKINEIKIANNEESVEDGAREDDSIVVSANLGKDDKGIEIYDPNEDQEANIEPVEENGESSEESGIETGTTTEESATTTETAETEAEAEEAVDKSSFDEANRILEEAEDLFNAEDYEGAANKLEEVDYYINITDVEAEESGDSATSTE